MQRMYFYRDTVIAVRMGRGSDNWATYHRKESGRWTTVKSKEMPRIEDRREADINFRVWATGKRLKRADCGSCPYFKTDEGFCTYLGLQLEQIEIVPGQPDYIKHKNCHR